MAGSNLPYAKHPSLTVVIPTKNRWGFLRTAIVSVLQQVPVAPAIIVIDDGSTDGTALRLQRDAHPSITILRHPDSLGVARARNHGLEHVLTPWVSFLDDDDVWAPFHLRDVMAAIEAAGEVDVAVAGSITTNGSRHPTKEKPAPAPEELPELLYRENVIGTPSRVALRADAVRAAGGFDLELSLAADWDMWLRVVRAGNVASTTGLSVGYTEHGANMHLGAGLALQELPRLEQRYAGASSSRLTDHCSPWLAECYRRSGHRFQAARWYVRSWRQTGRRRDLARAAGMLLGERAMAMSGLRHEPTVPEGVGDWLRSLAAIDHLPDNVSVAEALTSSPLLPILPQAAAA